MQDIASIRHRFSRPNGGCQYSRQADGTYSISFIADVMENKRVTEMLRRVRIPDPVAAYARYPHEFSGGMKQRIAIAMA